MQNVIKALDANLKIKFDRSKPNSTQENCRQQYRQEIWMEIQSKFLKAFY